MYKLKLNWVGAGLNGIACSLAGCVSLENLIDYCNLKYSEIYSKIPEISKTSNNFTQCIEETIKNISHDKLYFGCFWATMAGLYGVATLYFASKHE